MSSLKYVAGRISVAGARRIAASLGGASTIAASAGVEGAASAARQLGAIGRVDGRQLAVDAALGAASSGLGSLVKASAPASHHALTNSILAGRGELTGEAAYQYGQLQGWSRPAPVPVNSASLRAPTAPSSARHHPTADASTPRPPARIIMNRLITTRLPDNSFEERTGLPIWYVVHPRLAHRRGCAARHHREVRSPA